MEKKQTCDTKNQPRSASIRPVVSVQPSTQRLTASECILLLQSKQHSLEREIEKMRISLDSVQKQFKELNEIQLKDTKFQNDLLLKKIENFVSRESTELHPLKRYKDLPILKLNTGMNYTSWFSIYEKTMGTNDENILKSCLVYYFSESAQKGFLANFMDLEYKAIKTEMLKKPIDRLD